MIILIGSREEYKSECYIIPLDMFTEKKYSTQDMNFSVGRGHFERKLVPKKRKFISIFIF